MKFLQKNDIFYLGKILLLYSPFIIVLLILKPKGGHEFDLFCFTEWAKFSFTEGLSNIYKSWTDYLPLYHYVLFLFGKMQGSIEEITSNIYKLKSLTLFFEFGSTLILFKLLKNKYKETYKAVFYSLFYFLNLAVLYNSLIWGQVDGIMTFFIFVAVILAYKKRFFFSLLFFVLALNLKLQAIVFLPIIVLLILPTILDKEQIKRLICSFGGIGIIQLLIFLPFICAGDFSKLWNVITNSVGQYPKVSMNAYNMWYFFFNNPMEVSDFDKFLGITYKIWGLILFFVMSFFALLHFVKPFFSRLFKKIDVEYSYKKTLISCALIPFLFFFFNTQMHERYSHPAFIFLALYAITYKKPLVFILGSLAYFLNLEGVLQSLQTNNYYTLVFMPLFVSCLYLLVIVLLFFDLYDIRLTLFLNQKGNIQNNNTKRQKNREKYFLK